MRREFLTRVHQLFQQGVAEDHEVRLGPQRSQLDKKPVPITREQSLPKQLWRVQQCPVLVEDRDRVSHGAARRLTAGSVDLAGVQLIEALLRSRKTDPA